MPVWACFDYPADMPPDTTNRNAMCSNYPDDVPLGNSNRDDAQATSPAPRSMPYTCFPVLSRRTFLEGGLYAEHMFQLPAGNRELGGGAAGTRQQDMFQLPG